MYKVLKDFPGSPDGYTVINYKADTEVDLEPELAKVAIKEGWVEVCAEPAAQPANQVIDSLITLVKRPVTEIVAALPVLSDDDLVQLLALDAEDGKVRKTLTDAIAEVQAKRTAADEPPAE